MTWTFTPRTRGADKPLDNDGVLVALVLDEESVFGFVDEARDALAAIAAAPDEVRVCAGLEFLAVPVGLEAGDDFIDFVLVRGDDGVVARLGEVFRLPVERLHKGDFVVHDHRLFVRDAEVGVAVLDFDAGFFQRLAGLGVFLFAAAARGIEHDLDFDPAHLRGDDGFDQIRVGEDEHFDPERFLRGVDCVDDRLSGVVGENNDGAVGHGVLVGLSEEVSLALWMRHGSGGGGRRGVNPAWMR